MILRDKVIIITGGAGALGACFSQAILENGGNVVIADNNVEASAVLANKLAAEFGDDRVSAMYLDITCTSSVDKLLEGVQQKYGSISALVNNAYPRNENYGRDFFDVEYEDFCQNVNMNLGGYFLCSQRAAIYFQEQLCGNIINVASIYGLIAPKFNIYSQTEMTMPVEYAAIKSGLIHLTKFMAARFKGMNIRVNSLSPGGILDAQPQAFVNAYNAQCLNKGMLHAKDICGGLIFLLSHLSTHVNGQNLVIDDGFTL